MVRAADQPLTGVASTPSTAAPPQARSLPEIDDPAVRRLLEERLARSETLGLLLIGSRATGWAPPDGDYNVLIVVTPEHFRTVGPGGTGIHLHAEGEAPKRLIGHFTLVTEEAFRTALDSPLDVDHWPFQDAIVLADKSGRLPEWRRLLASFPEHRWKERALHKFLQLALAVSYATADDVRGFAADRQLNLFRATLAGVHLWFAMRRRWSPPLKWWSREVERLEIRPDTRAVLEGSIMNPTVETVTHLREHMKAELRHAGIAEVDDLPRVLSTTLLPERREAVYRDSFV